MIGCLLLLTTLWPQEPASGGRPPSIDVLRASCADAGATGEVAAILPVGRSRPRRSDSPALAVEIRAAGLGAADLARSGCGPLADAESAVDALLQVAARAHGDRRAVGASRPVRDLDAFEREISHVHRDLIQALGGRQDPDRAFARWGSIADRLAKRWIASAPDRDAADEAAGARAGMADAELRALAGRVLRAASELDADELGIALRGVDPRSARSDGAVQGDVFLDRDGPFGRLVVGGPGPNSYDCTQIDVIVDLGGSDEYRGPAGGAGGLRRLGVVVDLAGDDSYLGGQDSLGSATFGIGVLYDAGGDDRYRAVGRGLGFGVAGVGIFVDVEGADSYEVGALCCGVGCHGSGVFADLAGDDSYELGGLGAGVGLPGGFGLFFERAGNDVLEFARSESAPGGLGIGLGSGAREDGGLGVAVDLAGDDRVEGGAGVGGVGFDRGVGFVWDLGGSDQSDCASASLGFGASYGCGLLVDELGDDRRTAAARSLGFGEHSGFGFVLDCAGDDSTSGEHPSLGEGRHGGLGLHADLGGADRYRSTRADDEPSAAARRSPAKPAAVGLLLDLGGSDDDYEFDRLPGLVDGQTRRIEEGEAEPSVRYLVDTDAR